MQKYLDFLYNYFLTEHYDITESLSGITFNSEHIIYLIYLIYFFIFLITCIILILIWNIILNFKLKKFLMGNDAKSLETIIRNNLQDIEILKAEKEIIEKKISWHSQKLENTLRNNFTIKFKAGENSESNQSFATGFLNDLGNGVILSTLSIRNHTSIFAKPIKNYKSVVELNNEEQEVLKTIKEEHKKLR